MSHHTFAPPGSMPAAVPWGWRDLARALLLATLGFVVLCALVVAAVVVRQLSGTPDDAIVLVSSLEIGIYGSVLLAVYRTTVRRYRSSWELLGQRPVPWTWLLLDPLFVGGMLAAGGALTSLISAVQGQPFANSQIHDTTLGQRLAPAHLAVLLLGVGLGAGT